MMQVRVSSGLTVYEEKEFAQKNWWLHDAYWFTAVARACGMEAANTANLEATERAARSAALQLRKRGLLGVPRTAAELERTFRVMWGLFFPDGLYQESEFVWEGDRGEWSCTQCHAYEQVRRGGLLASYRCGCQAFREGVRKGLRAGFSHSIAESLVRGDPRCLVRFSL